MNASTEARLKIMKGQKHFPLDLVSRLLAERDALSAVNAKLRSARVTFIGGHTIQTEDGQTLYCEPVPVIEIQRKEK